MRVLVFGAGAIGSLFGARLAGAGHDVLLVARPAHAAAVRDRGLRVEGRVEGTYRVAAVERLPHETSTDGVLLTVKSYDVEAAAATIGAQVAPPAPLLMLQNGIGIEGAALAALGLAGWPDAPRWVVRGINTVPAQFVRPGVVRQTGEGEVLLGSAEAGAATSAVARFGRLLAGAGIPTKTAGDLPREVWRKLLVNAAINPVTADHGIVNGRLAKDPWRGQALALLHEALEVARAEGFEFTDAEVERDLWRVVQKTAENRSSMLQDVDAGRRTEVDAISGAILRLGAASGLRLPATRRVVARFRRRKRRSLPGPTLGGAGARRSLPVPAADRTRG
ncbi:MAG TPA: 2-dehydropantoate 2-reductase [Thermoplasmata archaeon]|nr:2-dehydropantoate 2-reductase [Thermoplasmata archaeon]